MVLSTVFSKGVGYMVLWNSSALAMNFAAQDTMVVKTPTIR